MINTDELSGRVCMLIQDFDPNVEGLRTWDDAIRSVLKLIEQMELESSLKLREMSDEQRWEYYRDKQRLCRLRKKKE